MSTAGPYESKRRRGRPKKDDSSAKRRTLAAGDDSLVREPITMQTKGHRTRMHTPLESARLLAGAPANEDKRPVKKRAPVDELTHGDINQHLDMYQVDDNTRWFSGDESSSEEEEEHVVEWQYVADNVAQAADDVERTIIEDEEDREQRKGMQYGRSQQRKRERWERVRWEALQHVARELSCYIPPDSTCWHCGNEGRYRCPECSRHEKQVSGNV